MFFSTSTILYTNYKISLVLIIEINVDIIGNDLSRPEYLDIARVSLHFHY